MAKLLVGSVFANHPRTSFWYKLQIEHLDKNTRAAFDHVVYANNCEATYFRRSSVIYESGKIRRPHLTGLRALLNYFVENMRLNRYDYYLILDSDAFPCARDWLATLLDLMSGKSKHSERLWAAVVRAENYEVYAHPCVVFMKKQLVKRLEGRLPRVFALKEHRLLTGRLDKDISCEIPRRIEGKLAFLPLLRSNVWNPHPVLCGIYGGLFYHHGAGSREARIKIVDDGGIRHILSMKRHKELTLRLWHMISQNRDDFVKELCLGQGCVS